MSAWSGAADAWFLDGFAPARNPQMWTAEVLNLVAARSAPGARLATFTVAGAVRRGLEAAGFAVEKRPGFNGGLELVENRHHVARDGLFLRAGEDKGGSLAQAEVDAARNASGWKAGSPQRPRSPPSRLRLRSGSR